MSPLNLLVARIALLLAAVSGGAAGAADPPLPPPPLAIKAVTVTPPSPGPDTLCRLAVTLTNSGDKIASRFELRVKVGGHELPAYRGRVFLAPLPAHGELELPLLNFWSTEPSRPAPPGGSLPVEVSLVDARWVERTVEDGVETWKPAAPAQPIAGLPLAKTVTLTLAPPPAAKKP